MDLVFIGQLVVNRSFLLLNDHDGYLTSPFLRGFPSVVYGRDVRVFEKDFLVVVVI